MTLRNSLLSLATILVLLLAVLFQQSPLVRIILHSLTVSEGYELTDNAGCRPPVGSAEAPLEACEKIVVHQESGVVYLACSSISERLSFAPYLEKWGPASAETDYIATYDPSTSPPSIKRLSLLNFTDPRGLHVHGMDVVPSSTEPDVLWVYAVNHRPRLDGEHETLGADEAIEVFRTTVGGDTLTHVKTFDDPAVVITPNDVAGSDDGLSVYFTNDHPVRIGKWERTAMLFFATPSTSVGYCHATTGCKLAATGIPGANGIVKTDPNTVWVGGASDGKVRRFMRQDDDTLLLEDVISLGRLVDNLSTDGKGNIYATIAAGIPTQAVAYMEDPAHEKCQSAAFNISLSSNGHKEAPEKYSVSKIFEDNGSLISLVTTVAHDANAGLLYLTGPFAKSPVACPA